MSYDNGYLTAIKKYVPNSTEDDPFRIIEQHTHSKNDGKTTTVSQYPSATNPLYSTTTVFDKYGRLESVEDTLENVYCLDSYCYYADDNGDYMPETDIENYDRDRNGELIFGTIELDGRDALLSRQIDHLRNETIQYGYDGDKLVAAVITNNANNSVIKQELFTYDSANRLTKDKLTYEIMNPQTVESEIGYYRDANDALPDDRVSSYTYKVNGSTKLKTDNTFDEYKRITEKKYRVGKDYFIKDIEYENTRVSRIADKKDVLNNDDIVLSDISYEYDELGRIIKEKNVDENGNETVIKSYTYDEYGQLTREDNQPLDKTLKYEYNNTTNNVGNVCSVKAYPYTPAGTELSDNPTTTTFYYNDTSNPDRLTRYGNKNITYNSKGFPITYGNKTLAWSLGQLTRYYDDIDENDTLSSESTEFEYNALGQRIRKEYVYNPGSDYSGDFLIGTTSEYTYDHSGRLIREFTTDYFTESASETRVLVFLYDESSMVGFTYSKNGATATSYYYQRNLFGDVVAIYNTSGTKIAGYNYDAWGNHTITASTTINRIIAKANPIRYRGYYYDEETKLYYLNARYYSPEWRRFISPDDTSYLNPESVNGLNLYCYCGNDPVNYADPSGHFALTTFGIWAIVGIVTFATIVGGGAQLASNALAGKTGSDLWQGVPGAALGSGANALALCLLPATWGGYLTVSALFGASIQTGVDTIETLIRGENVSLKQTAVDFGTNFITTFVGNWIGSTTIPTNTGWFKPQKFLSVYTKPHGQKILAQTVIGAGVSGIVNFERKFNRINMNKIYYIPSIPSPILSTYLYR